MVWSRNPDTGKTELKPVVRTFAKVAYATGTVALADKATGKQVTPITGTLTHPFFTTNGVVCLGDLGIGTEILTRAGPPQVVQSVTVEQHPEGVAVYNFEVEGDHTYFVGTAGGGAWVYNDCDPVTLFHYTSEENYESILASNELRPSLKAVNPKDARFGDGQYLTDIIPGTRTPASLAGSLIRKAFPRVGLRRFSHFIEIDTTGLTLLKGGKGAYLVPNSRSLDLTNRIISHGPVQWKLKL